MTCQHMTYSTGPALPFLGPCDGAEENRAAHGCVSFVDTCRHCGAQRRSNVNQCHVEDGPWDRTAAREAEAAAERLAAAKRMVAAARARLVVPLYTMIVVREGVHAWVEDDGCIETTAWHDGDVIRGSATLDELAAVAPEFLARAAEYRRAVLALDAARAA